jgi:RNA polymerase sigma-70 factor, ECF subfamily
MAGGLSKARETRLVRLAAAGDRAAASELITSHQASVYAYILRLCGRNELAEDVVQEAFVRVLTNLDRFDPTYRFSTWLFTIARRVLMNGQARKSASSDTDLIESLRGGTGAGNGDRIGGGRSGGTGGGWGDSSGEPGTREEQFWQRDAIQRAMFDMPAIQREILVLFHQHDWPIWLIAEHLELPEGTVKSHLHRGRMRLRDGLRRVERTRGMVFDETQPLSGRPADPRNVAHGARKDSAHQLSLSSDDLELHEADSGNVNHGHDDPPAPVVRNPRRDVLRGGADGKNNRTREAGQ